MFGALARTSVTEALFFSRTYAESTRQLLFERLISSVLDDRAVGGARNKELVSLPLDGAEESWFNDYLTDGEGSKLKLAATTVETRRIITGRHRGRIRTRGLDDSTAAPKPTRSRSNR